MAETKTSRTAKPAANNPRARLYMLSVFVFFWLCLIIGRLVVLQVVRYGEFTQRAARQQQRTVEVAPKRGGIYDRNGHELAMTISVDSLFAVPSEIPDQATTATLLARILQSDPKEILNKLESSRSFTWIARRMDAESANRVRALNLKGMYFQKESKRFYPKRELASQVLGYVGMDDEGLGGVERSFDEKLRGRPGKMLVSVDARQKSLGRVEKQPEPGDNLVLTIDEKIQYIAERELERTIEATHAEAGTVVVQNPKTGEILALASRPTFNPNTFNNVPAAALKNRAVSDIYEPGSTFKIITLSAALEEKLTTPDELIDCQMGKITIFGHTIHDHKPYGLLTTTQIMQNSSDVGAIKLGMRFGEQRLDHYIRAYGFGAQTGVEVPGETRGMAKPVTRWSKVSIGAISMGQEIGVSAVQLVFQASTIANDGIYTSPRIVAGSIATKGTPQTVLFKPVNQRRVISSLTAAQMRLILENTVLFGTGKKAILDGYTSGGKTGTAQKVDSNTGRYSSSKYIASFAGFAPVKDPAITISVMLDSPQGPHQGGTVSAPLFANIAQQVLAYMNVPRDADVKNPQRLMLRASAKESDLEEGSPERLGGSEEVAEVTTTKAAAPPVSTPAQAKTAKMVNASFKLPVEKAEAIAPPLPAAPASSSVPPSAKGTVILDVGNGPVAPSLLGKTVRNALESAQQAGVEMEVIGSGLAQSQSPPPGERV